MARCNTSCVSLLVCCAISAFAVSTEANDYLTKVKPVLRERCYACHGALKQEAGLRLDTVALMTKGGDSGAALNAGDAASLLLAKITADEGERMPPEGEPLKPVEIAVIRGWITGGAAAPADEQPERDPRDHWAFKAAVRPTVPKVANEAWQKNPIDAFIAAEFEKRKLAPQKPADKRLWLRRVSLDLVGLPPTIEEQNAFLADESPEAYEKVVARLLDSPQYGERWGRHFMDIWRYSDWWGLGAEVRNSQKHIWHWRDWIIESLNADKGYDQMLREMLAADELYPNDMDKLRGGGFLARQYFKFNRTSWLDETVEHTGKAMLGLTFNCAKCHDHKYDPFSQVEYYQLRAIFEPYQVRTEFVPGELDPEKNGIPRPFDCNLDAQTFLHIRGDDRNPDQSKVIEPKPPAFLMFAEFSFVPVQLPVEAYEPGLREFIVQAHLKQAQQNIEQTLAELKAAREQLKKAEANKEVAAPATDVEKAKTVNNEQPKSLVSDDFKTEKPDWWEPRSGKWEYAGGKLTQSETGATRGVLRLKAAPPENFEARFKYVPTGGQMWKSVGISFDVGEDGDMVTAYLSSVANGPKAQISYKQNGKDIYPPAASQARKVELNQEHELLLRVQGTLINLLVDGEPSLSYRLPITRRKGSLDLITFDAAAQFVSFELRELGAGEQLVDSRPDATTASTVLSVEDASERVKIAEQAHAAVNLTAQALQKRAAAQRTRRLDPAPADLKEQLADAVQAELLAAVAQAEVAVDRLKLELRLAPPAKQEEVKKKVAAAEVVLAKASEAKTKPSANFTPLVGALKTLENNLEKEDSRRKPFPTTSTGRRTAFANWITDPRHPLPARVVVNHVWNRHFGRALVPTVFDFGRKGTPPTHPELLDWLAVELRENNWSLKHLHRLICTSQTYRLSSSNLNASAAALTVDPENKHYWRANPLRMEAQLVRDSLLHLAGELDLTRGGPSIPVTDANSKRRSLYFVHSHNEHQQFLSIFDDANVLECYRRSESIVPQQALALENSPLATAMAEKIAGRLPTGSDEEFIRAGFLAVLADEPTQAELDLVTSALKQLTEIATQKKTVNAAAQARVQIIHALLNHNDFVTIR